jgi:hypothetical protein
VVSISSLPISCHKISRRSAIGAFDALEAGFWLLLPFLSELHYLHMAFCMEDQMKALIAVIAGAPIALFSLGANPLSADPLDDLFYPADANGVLPIERILDEARNAVPGTITEVELEPEHGKLIYEVEILTLLWQIWLNRFEEWLVAMWASRGWWPREEVKDGLPDVGHAGLRRRSPDSFFSVPLL